MLFNQLHALVHSCLWFSYSTNPRFSSFVAIQTVTLGYTSGELSNRVHLYQWYLFTIMSPFQKIFNSQVKDGRQAITWCKSLHTSRVPVSGSHEPLNRCYQLPSNFYHSIRSYCSCMLSPGLYACLWVCVYQNSLLTVLCNRHNYYGHGCGSSHLLLTTPSTFPFPCMPATTHGRSCQ